MTTCQAKNFGHPRECSLTADVHVLLTRPDQVTYSMSLCTPHSMQLLQDLPNRVRTYGSLTVEIGYVPPLPGPFAEGERS